MSRHRVLHCIYDDLGNPWLGGGGAHRVFEIYRRLTGELDATVATGAYPGAADGMREGVRYVHVGRKRPYALSRLTFGRAATTLLASAAYDAAFFDFSVYTPVRVPSARPVAHVVHMPIGASARERWGRLAGGLVERRERWMLRRARRVQTTSRWMAERLRALVAPGAEVRVVGSGVDPSFFAVERRESDHVLFFGRFDVFQKGLDVLLAAAPQILATRPDVRLVLAGAGRDGARLRRRVEAAGLGGRVSLVSSPERSRVQQLMGGALCLVHPSRFEGFPVVPLEAMAAGVPVVATRVGALEEVLGHPPAGRLVRPRDAGGLAAGVLELLQDRPLRDDLSARARESARRFSWEVVAAEHLAHVRELVAGH